MWSNAASVVSTLALPLEVSSALRIVVLRVTNISQRWVIAFALGAPVRIGGLIGAAAAADARLEPTSNKANLERM